VGAEHRDPTPSFLFVLSPSPAPTPPAITSHIHYRSLLDLFCALQISSLHFVSRSSLYYFQKWIYFHWREISPEVKRRTTCKVAFHRISPATKSDGNARECEIIHASLRRNARECDPLWPGMRLKNRISSHSIAFRRILSQLLFYWGWIAIQKSRVWWDRIIRQQTGRGEQTGIVCEFKRKEERGKYVGQSRNQSTLVLIANFLSFVHLDLSLVVEYPVQLCSHNRHNSWCIYSGPTTLFVRKYQLPNIPEYWGMLGFPSVQPETYPSRSDMFDTISPDLSKLMEDIVTARHINNDA